MAVKTDTRQLIDSLKQERDELRLKLHLASMEMQDMWHQVEHHWDNVNLKLHRAADEADDAGEDIAEALQLLLEEIRNGYQKIRKVMK
ncbi:MAG TPA: hypothetical protein VIN71_12750 [Pseudomonadales bacterium]